MKHDCIYFDECTDKHMSDCCGHVIIHHDICYECKEHCSDGCEGCDIYRTDQDMRDAEGERKYECNKNDNL